MGKGKLKGKAGKRSSKRLLGTFSLSGGKGVVGELQLAGEKTNLRLHSDEFLTRVEDGSCLTGTTYDGHCLTLIDCRSPGSGHSSRADGPIRYHADVFPHYVAVGDRHFNSVENCVSGIHVTTTDLKSIFYDFDAFSHVIDSRPIIDAVLAERRRDRPIETGEWPHVYYFTGRHTIAEVSTAIGQISVNHLPKSSMGGPSGFYMKNRIAISIEFESPISFSVAVDRMYEVCCFLSTVAGRAQGIERIDIGISGSQDTPQMLQVHQSYKWKTKDIEHSRPHPADLPLNPIDRREEFATVLANWLTRHSDWRAARGQYLGCLKKGNKYGVDRLVAAANMFDILPTSAFPPSTPLDTALASTRDTCVQLFRKLPAGSDRNSALSALGRLGQLSSEKGSASSIHHRENSWLQIPGSPICGEHSSQVPQFLCTWKHRRFGFRQNTTVGTLPDRCS